MRDAGLAFRGIYVIDDAMLFNDWPKFVKGQAADQAAKLAKISGPDTPEASSDRTKAPAPSSRSDLIRMSRLPADARAHRRPRADERRGVQDVEAMERELVRPLTEEEERLALEPGAVIEQPP
jgi:hypothetical protein